MNLIIHLTLLIPLLYSISCEESHSENETTSPQVLHNLNQNEAAMFQSEGEHYGVNSPVGQDGLKKRRDISRGTGRDWKLKLPDPRRVLADRRYRDRQANQPQRRKNRGQRQRQRQRQNRGQHHEQHHVPRHHPQNQQPHYWESRVYATHTNPYPQYQEYYHPYGPPQGHYNGGYNYDFSYQVQRPSQPPLVYEPVHMQFAHYRNPIQGSHFYPPYGPSHGHPNPPQWFGDRYQNAFGNLRMIQHDEVKPKSKSRTRSRSRSRSRSSKRI